MPNNAWRTDWHKLLKYHESLFSIAPAGVHLTFGNNMKTLLKHLVALSISVVIAAPIFAVNGAYAEFAAGRIPWIAGSIFMSAIWSVFLSILVSAPVATISVYIVEHRVWVKWPLEPLILLGVTAAYCGPVALFAFGGSLPLAVTVVLSLYFPALIYFLILRAISLRECI